MTASTFTFIQHLLRIIIPLLKRYHILFILVSAKLGARKTYMNLYIIKLFLLSAFAMYDCYEFTYTKTVSHIIPFYFSEIRRRENLHELTPRAFTAAGSGDPLV